MIINDLLQHAVQHRASDLHLSTGSPPLIRVDGELCHLNNTPIIDDSLIIAFLTTQQYQQYQLTLSLDFAFHIDGLCRFRANIFQQQRGMAAVFRILAETIIPLESLGLPNTLKTLCHYPHGLVLITGATGSGKTTTITAMLDYINQTRPVHILTLEDPIEFIHHNQKALINQREINRDVSDFNAALRSALREDPDIIFIGELRDLETIRLALTAAETGHLVFATVHTASAAKTIHRLVDVFPGDEKAMVRALLAETLQAVASQTLVKKSGGGRTAALEIMTCTPAIRNLIREDKIAQMYSMIQTGAAQGMQTLEQHLQILMTEGIILANTDH